MHKQDTRAVLCRKSTFCALFTDTDFDAKPSEPDWEDRDRFILSKGHASPGMYAVLAEMGFISHKDLESYRLKEGFARHVDMKWCPGVDFSAGSLGMGLSLEWAVQ